MVKSILVKVGSIVFVMLALAACAPQAVEESAPESEGADELIAEVTPAVADEAPKFSAGSVNDYLSLVDALRAEGLAVVPQDSVQQEFFPVTAQVVLANGELVQVFEFEDAEAAQAAAATISPDGGSVGTTMVTWVDTPHFYHSGRLIVLHVGNSAEVTAALKSALGAQIAGR